MDEQIRARIDALYDLPGAEFVAARNALAKEVPREDRGAVRGLRRPSKVAEAVNRAVRSGDPSALLEAGEVARSGGNARAVRAAAEALAQGTPDALWADVVGALRLAALDPALRDDLAAGRLHEAPQASGFDLLLGVEPAAADSPQDARGTRPAKGSGRAARRTRGSGEAKTKKAAKAQEAARAAAQRDVTAARDAVAAARDEARSAGAAADAARETAREAAANVEEQRAALAAAEARATDALAEQEQREARREQADRALAEARAALDAAQETLEAQRPG